MADLKGRLWLAATLGLLLGSLFVGCAANTQRIDSQQFEIDDLKREIMYLKDQSAQFQRELERLAKQLADTEQAGHKEKADFAAQVDALRAEISALQNQYSDTNYRLTALNQQTGTGRTAMVVAAAPDSSATSGMPPITSDQALELYNSSYRDLLRGNYQLALAGLTEYLRKYPTTDLTDNAQYWVGEVYYAQGRYVNAIEEFEKVIRDYPGGDKKSSALLKIAYAYINMEENEQGRLYLEEVIREYPDSEEANLAKGRLATLN
jgi:tol-pal system protein YbgF